MYFDKCLFPVTPEKISIKINGNNKTVNLINEGEINILKKAGLTDIEFEAEIPQVKHPYAVYKNGFKEAGYFFDIFEGLKTGKKTFQFIVCRKTPVGKKLLNTNMKVSLEDYKISEDALDLTLTNTGEMYVLYDDFGKLTLKSLSSMYVGVPGAYLMIDEETGQNFDYTSSIDENTYNKIKLTYDNKDTGKRDVYITQDSSNINKWGILQYFDTLQKGENGQAKADALLKLYNKKTRNLKITNALGDNRVRAGSMVVINLDLGDVKLKNWMLVEKCKHTYKEGEHWMDLTLRGGEFVA